MCDAAGVTDSRTQALGARLNYPAGGVTVGITLGFDHDRIVEDVWVAPPANGVTAVIRRIPG
jgi:hypothetical protein